MVTPNVAVVRRKSGTPPSPLSAAVRASAAFVDGLNDQVAEVMDVDAEGGGREHQVVGGLPDCGVASLGDDPDRLPERAQVSVAWDGRWVRDFLIGHVGCLASRSVGLVPTGGWGQQGHHEC